MSRQQSKIKTEQQQRGQGKCVWCGKPTSFNRITGAPYKLCDYHRIVNSAKSRANYQKKHRSVKHKSAGGGSEGLLNRYRPDAARRYLHPCQECGIEVHEDFYYCPWCGAKQCDAEIIIEKDKN